MKQTPLKTPNLKGWVLTRSIKTLPRCPDAKAGNYSWDYPNVEDYSVYSSYSHCSIQSPGTMYIERYISHITMRECSINNNIYLSKVIRRKLTLPMHMFQSLLRGRLQNIIVHNCFKIHALAIIWYIHPFLFHIIYALWKWLGKFNRLCIPVIILGPSGWNMGNITYWAEQCPIYIRSSVTQGVENNRHV